ncbi:MAG: SRPBCC family protein [Pseudomonadota bacterium]
MAELTLETPGELDAVITRDFDAPRALIWRCMTEPALVRRWLLGPPGWTMPVCEIDLRVGGSYRYVWQSEADNSEMGMGGVYQEIVAPDRIVDIQRFDEDWTGGETLVTVELAERDGRTTMTTTVRYSSSEAREAMLATGMTGGMEAGYARLDDLLGELG